MEVERQTALRTTRGQRHTGSQTDRQHTPSQPGILHIHHHTQHSTLNGLTRTYSQHHLRVECWVYVEGGPCQTIECWVWCCGWVRVRPTQHSTLNGLTRTHSQHHTPTLHPQRSDTDPPTAPHPTLYGLTRTALNIHPTLHPQRSDTDQPTASHPNAAPLIV